MLFFYVWPQYHPVTAENMFVALTKLPKWDFMLTNIVQELVICYVWRCFHHRMHLLLFQGEICLHRPCDASQARVEQVHALVRTAIELEACLRFRMPVVSTVIQLATLT
jgi:hypothetical protein